MIDAKLEAWTCWGGLGVNAVVPVVLCHFICPTGRAGDDTVGASSRCESEGYGADAWS